MNPELFDFSESETYNYEKGDARGNAMRIVIFFGTYRYGMGSTEKTYEATISQYI